jgi:hypothetical protein
MIVGGLLRGKYVDIRGREERTSRSLQTATRPHWSEVVVWALKININERKTLAIYFPRRL